MEKIFNVNYRECSVLCLGILISSIENHVYDNWEFRDSARSNDTVQYVIVIRPVTVSRISNPCTHV